MPTRRQNSNDKKFRQDAFASSAEHDRGSLGNLVAARCHKLTDPQEIAMVWWLQQVSWRDGGLKKFAADFLGANEYEIGTVSMHKHGMKPGQIYSAEQVKEIREDGDGFHESRYPLKGERPEFMVDYLQEDYFHDRARQSHEKKDAIAAKYPSHYSIEDFKKNCGIDADSFAEKIAQTLVDPAADSLRSGLWNFPTLWEKLTEWRGREIAAARKNIVETEITRTVAEELDFALHSKSFILIEGREGIGKSEAAKSWCGQHPGQAVYVRLDSGSDEPSLYRSLARAVGTACSYGYKTAQMRARVQDALQAGHLMLVIDEAHFLFPQSERSQRSAPMRLEWVRTALVDFGVPVALISTPQYFAKACGKFIKSGWNSNQVQRRLVQTVLLPEEISVAEMLSVARHYFPNASVSDLKQIALTSTSKMGFLTIIMHLRKRVDFLASKKPGRRETDYIGEALAVYNGPVEEALPHVCKAPDAPLQRRSIAPADQLPRRVISPAQVSRVKHDEGALTVA